MKLVLLQTVRRIVSGTMGNGNGRILAVAFMSGMVFGLAIYTFLYAGGVSYLSADPQACVNCHAMNQVFEGWKSGDHRHTAACVDCHLPEGFFMKWLVKSENGFWHSFVFTFLDVPMNIRARGVSRDVVRMNCRRCHDGMAVFAVRGVAGSSEPLDCFACHARVGHAHH